MHTLCVYIYTYLYTRYIHVLYIICIYIYTYNNILLFQKYKYMCIYANFPSCSFHWRPIFYQPHWPYWEIYLKGGGVPAKLLVKRNMNGDVNNARYVTNYIYFVSWKWSVVFKVAVFGELITFISSVSSDKLDKPIPRIPKDLGDMFTHSYGNINENQASDHPHWVGSPWFSTASGV